MSFFWRVLFLCLGILLINLQLAVHQGEFAPPVTIALEGLGARQLAAVRVQTVYPYGFEETIVPSRPGLWEGPPRCTVDLLVEFPEPPPPEAVARIDVGDRSFTMPVHELPSLQGIYWLPDEVRLGDPPRFAVCRNWPGMQVFAAFWLARSVPGLAVVLILTLAVTLGLRAPFAGRLQECFGLLETLPAPPATLQRFWNLVGWAFLIGGFIGLECLEPYYFTQDDALLGELPGILLGMRSLWQGTFPDWNPYVFLGAPLAIIGFWAITYPLQVLSYAIARHMVGDEFATMEVFAALHLLVGFVAMRHLSRRIGMSALTANLAALSFVFAGSILIMGRSWHAFVANAAWFPLLGIAIQRFREGPVGWKWIVGVGMVFGLSYHAGFPQVAALLGMFFVLGLAAVVLAEPLPWRRLLPVAPALLLGAGLAAPLLLHHLQWTGGLERRAPFEEGIYDGLPGALFPYPLVEAELPTHWGGPVEKIGHFYFFGGLFALLFLLQVFAFWLAPPERGAWGRHWWLPCGIFALIMLLGEPALLWKGAAALPLSKFFLRYTFRFYPWLAFCAILSGGRILECLLATQRRRARAEGIVGALLLAILAYHLSMCASSFYSYGFRPYPPLPEDFEAVFHPYEDRQFIGPGNSRRIASWTQERSPAPDFYLALPLNLPHYYQVPSIFGYDPVVQGQRPMAEVFARLRKDPQSACKAYGVGWHLFHYPDPPVHGSNPYMHPMERNILWEQAYHGLQSVPLRTLAEFHGAALKELPGADPLAFATARPTQPLPMHLHGRGADVDVAAVAAGESITLNFLAYPQMRLTLDGQPLPVEKDDWQRITTTLPRSGTALALRFEPPWGRTCAIGAALCLAALALTWVTLRWRPA